MKSAQLAVLAIAALVSVSCDKQKEAVEEKREATREAIDDRKDEVDANAKQAIKQTEMDATINKALIEANTKTTQAQLDADKKAADADAAAAKAKIDAENK